MLVNKQCMDPMDCVMSRFGWQKPGLLICFLGFAPRFFFGASKKLLTLRDSSVSTFGVVRIGMST